MNRILVLGYGNPTRSDDGVGCVVANALMKCGINGLVTQQLLPELAPEIANAERVIFVDASVEGIPGTWDSMPLPTGEMALSYDSLTHHLGPTELLWFAETLYGRAPEAVLITVVGCNFAFGETLSPEIEALMPEVVAHVLDLCEEVRGYAPSAQQSR